MTSVQETAAPAGLCSGPQSPCHRSQRCWGCSALTAATALKLSGLWAVLSTQLQLVEDPQGPRAWNHQSLANGAGGEPGKQVAGNTEIGEEGLRIWVLQGELRVSPNLGIGEVYSQHWASEAGPARLLTGGSVLSPLHSLSSVTQVTLTGVLGLALRTHLFLQALMRMRRAATETRHAGRGARREPWW